MASRPAPTQVPVRVPARGRHLTPAQRRRRRLWPLVGLLLVVVLTLVWVQVRPQAAPRTGAEGVDDPNSLTVVVNKQRPLPQGWEPTDLVKPEGVPGDAERVRAEAAGPLQQMVAAAEQEAGLRLTLLSGYRSYLTQQDVYARLAERTGRANAELYSARAGHSEHQTGLAVDLGSGSGKCTVEACFGTMAEGRWLADNAWRFGFMLRYYDGAQPVVGYGYEPWHFRYVGPQVAAELRASGVLTLEEFYGLPAAPDYPA